MEVDDQIRYQDLAKETIERAISYLYNLHEAHVAKSDPKGKLESDLKQLEKYNKEIFRAYSSDVEQAIKEINNVFSEIAKKNLNFQLMLT